MRRKRFESKPGRVWRAIFDLKKLARTTQTVSLADVPNVVARMFEGKVQGRIVVDVNA
jgi:hypothetical protein